mgnify:CR=1 FL=1
MSEVRIKNFKRVLVANRGEIAIRVFRALNELGITSVAVYSKEDKYAMFRTLADEAYPLNPEKGPIDAYLDIPTILKIAKDHNVDAIHPGYGFLAENPVLVEECEKNGITFIGPTVDSMNAMGDKISSKQIAIASQVPIIPGVDHAMKTVEEAMEVGYPVMLKASNGGGGRGMRIVSREEDMPKEFKEAIDESKKAFGDDQVFIEKYLKGPKHVEVQVLADNYGNVVHLFDRDCSVQRRHQKVVEYAPAFSVPEASRQKIFDSAIRLCKQVGYRNAGTCEFLVDSDGNPYFIDYRLLADTGLLTADEVPAARPVGPIDYGALYNERPVILKKAADRLLAAPSPSYEAFCEAQSFWLEDYALFMAVKAEQGQAGLADWPDDLRCRKPEAIAAAKQRLAGAVDYYKAVQFFFYTQWNALKAYANSKGVRLVGDIPIYVSPDSSDLWTHPELFQTDGEMHLTQVAGCPPDAFAADGQLWGNPLYDWPTHKATGFAWWKQRMKHATSIYDVVRIDHFRGFESYYSIPAGNKTAAGGHWEKGPDRDFIHAMHEALGEGGIIAEDLGYLTPEVKAMLAESGYPGMKIMQFAFDSRESGNYLPHTYPRNSVVYTGTHDNETLVSWYQTISDAERAMVRDYLYDYATPDEQLYKSMIALILRSAAARCIIPMQDWLGLDNAARINKPSTVGQNWRWRLKKTQLTKKLQKEICQLTTRYGRMNWA